MPLYIKGTKIRNKTKCTPQFQNAVRTLTPGLPSPYQVQSLVRTLGLSNQFGSSPRLEE